MPILRSLLLMTFVTVFSALNPVQAQTCTADNFLIDSLSNSSAEHPINVDTSRVGERCIHQVVIGNADSNADGVADSPTRTYFFGDDGHVSVTQVNPPPVPEAGSKRRGAAPRETSSTHQMMIFPRGGEFSAPRPGVRESDLTIHRGGGVDFTISLAEGRVTRAEGMSITDAGVTAAPAADAGFTVTGSSSALVIDLGSGPRGSRALQFASRLRRGVCQPPTAAADRGLPSLSG
jgi:hypothetical protein